MEPLVSLITAPISISASTYCPPGTRLCGIPLGKLLKQLLVSICALKRVCNCVSRCGPTSPLQRQYGLSARRADDSLSFLESLRSLMLWRRGQTESPAANAAAEIFLFSSYFSILLRAHLICVSWICMCVCVFCCQLCLRCPVTQISSRHLTAC